MPRPSSRELASTGPTTRTQIARVQERGVSVVNDAEACIVVEIYRRYLALKSVHALRDELAGAGIKSKRRTRPGGAEYGGQKFSRGALYLILQNRIYRGEIPHKGNSYPGERRRLSTSRCGTMSRPCWPQTGWSGQRERAQATPAC